MSRFNRHPAITDVIGHKLKTIRERDGRSQNQLARAVGVTSGTVSRYEAGEHGPSVSMLCEIADQLGCEPGELLPSLAEIRAALYGSGGA